MEALCVQSWEEDRMMMMEEEEVQKSGDKEEGGVGASSPLGSVTDEETEEDSEPEPPTVTRRKVSFADAFGLNLVSVKEFDNAEATGSEESLPPEREPSNSQEDFYMSCLFTVPSSPEELDQRLQAQMVELESIELLPGTTTVRGIIRVVNLCYSKSVYARMSLDHWKSYFDLAAEYVPGSSDRKTDRFTFNYTLVPPFEKERTEVELCLCYDTPLGTYWANNKEMNYVLFCYKRGHVNEHAAQGHEDSSYKSKRSCLRASRRASTEGKTQEISNTTAVSAETEAAQKAEEIDRKALNKAEIQSLLNHKALVDSIKGRRRETRMARVQDYISQQRQHLAAAHSHDRANGQEVHRPLPTMWGDSNSFLNRQQKGPRVLTYHEIPLLTLDWNDAHQWGAAHTDDLWGGSSNTASAEALADNEGDSTSVNMWENVPNATADSAASETSVFDVWQAFLNESSYKEHSGVSESEWPQSATSGSPTNDPKTPSSTISQEHEFTECIDVPTPLHTTDCYQALSDTLTGVASNAADHHPAEACVSIPRDDNTAPQDVTQRSAMTSRTDTQWEFSLEGAKPESKGSVDRSAECQKIGIQGQEREGIIEEPEGVADELCTLPTTDLKTSSWESETADMPAMTESHDSVADRISHGARLDEGVSSGREDQATGTVHSATDDILAFSWTIIQGAQDEETLEEIAKNCTEEEVFTGEEIFRPQNTEECEISQRYVDEKQLGEFRLNRNSENPLQENGNVANEIRPFAHSHTGEFSPKQTCHDNFKQSEGLTSIFKSEESMFENVASNNLEAFEKAEAEPFNTTSQDTKRLIGEETEITQLNEEEWQNNGKALQLNSSHQSGNTSINLRKSNKLPKAIQAEGELNIQKEEENSKLTPIQEDIGLKSEAGKYESFFNWCGERHRAGFEGVETRWAYSRDNIKDLEEAIGPKDVDQESEASRYLQGQPETLERAEQDTSQRGSIERVSIIKLKIELGEMTGNVGIPRGEGKKAPPQLKDQELSAGGESSPWAEYEELSEGTKDPITAENTVALELKDSGVEKMIIERFGEDLVRAIWEELFNLKMRGSDRDLNADEMDSKPADKITQDILFEKDTLDSGVFSLTELPSDLSLTQSLENAQAPKNDVPKDRSQELITTEQTSLVSESGANSNLRAHLDRALVSILAAQGVQQATDEAKRSSSDQENHTQITERQETGRQIDEREAAHKESFNPSEDPTGTSCEKLKESNSLIWWSILFILSQITKLLICSVVAGLFFIVFQCDFPAFFAIYIFCLLWWIYKCKRRHAVTTNGMVG